MDFLWIFRSFSEFFSRFSTSYFEKKIADVEGGIGCNVHIYVSFYGKSQQLFFQNKRSKIENLAKKSEKLRKIHKKWTIWIRFFARESENDPSPSSNQRLLQCDSTCIVTSLQASFESNKSGRILQQAMYTPIFHKPVC